MWYMYQSMAFLQACSLPLAMCMAFFQATYLAWLCFKHLAGPRSWHWLYLKPYPFGWAWAEGLANTFHKSSRTALCFWFHGCKNEPLLPCCLPKILACMSRKSWDSGICTSELDGMPNEIWAPAGTSFFQATPGSIIFLEGNIMFSPVFSSFLIAWISFPIFRTPWKCYLCFSCYWCSCSLFTCFFCCSWLLHGLVSGPSLEMVFKKLI